MHVEFAMHEAATKPSRQIVYRRDTRTVDDRFIGIHYIKVFLFFVSFVALLPALLAVSTLLYLVAGLFGTAKAGRHDGVEIPVV